MDVDFTPRYIGMGFSGQAAMNGTGWPDYIIIDNDRDLGDPERRTMEYRAPRPSSSDIGRCATCGHAVDIRFDNYCNVCGREIISEVQ